MEEGSRSTEFVALGHPGSECYAGLETFTIGAGSMSGIDSSGSKS